MSLTSNHYLPAKDLLHTVADGWLSFAWEKNERVGRIRGGVGDIERAECLAARYRSKSRRWHRASSFCAAAKAEKNCGSEFEDCVS
jgi:hypothetical protein